MRGRSRDRARVPRARVARPARLNRLDERTASWPSTARGRRLVHNHDLCAADAPRSVNWRPWELPEHEALITTVRSVRLRRLAVRLRNRSLREIRSDCGE